MITVNSWVETKVKMINKLTVERMLGVLNLSVKYKVLKDIYNFDVDKDDLLWNNINYDESLYNIPKIGWATIIDALEVSDQDSAVIKIVKFTEKMKSDDFVKIETNIYLNNKTLIIEDMDIIVKKLIKECVN